MLLRSLELMGFKSFADKVRVEFGPGVSAVVGPNGSGKSNLGEAVRWVLGEGSVRSLRGQRMEDVIFGGSPSRRPLPLCEVTVTLDNSDGTLALPFTEVTVSRRVDRTGQSEYLINRSPARLRDVQELFAGTGLGVDAYALVGQGQVDEVLRARPADRRAMVEEASGVTRYRVRLTDAARRLERADEGVLRLRDVLRERGQRVAALAAEADRAVRHEAISAELRALEMGLWAAELLTLRQRQETAAQAVRRAEGQLRDALERLGAITSAQRGLATELARLRQEEAASSGARMQAETALGAQRQAAQLAASLQRSALEEAQRASGRMAEVAERLAALQADGRDLEAERALSERTIASLRDKAQEARAALDAVRAERGRIVEERSVLGSRRAGLQARRQALQSGAQVMASAREALERVAHSRQVAAEVSARADQDLASARAEARALEAEIASGEEVLRRHRAHRDQLAAWRVARQARLDALGEMARQAVGYAQGPRTVLAGKQRGAPAFAGVIGALGELLVVPGHLVAAIAAALGGAVQDLVAISQDAAQAAIEGLKASQGGRATFLPLDGLAVRPPDRNLEQVATEPGALGWAADLIGFDPVIRQAVEHALGRVLVVDNLATARRIGRAVAYRVRIVTLQGDVIHPGGAMSGGTIRGDQGGGVLGRDAERRALMARLGAVQADLDLLGQVIGALEETEGQATARLRSLTARRDAADRAAAGARAVLQATQAEEQRLSQRVEAAASRDGASLEASLGEEERSLERELGERDRRLGGLEAEEARCREAETACRVALAEAEQRGRGLADLVRQRQRELGALEAQVASLRADHDRATERARQQAAARVRAEAAAAELEAQSVLASQREAQVRASEAAAQARAEAQVAQREQVEAERDRLHEALRRAEGDRGRADAALAALEARVDLAYGLPLADLGTVEPSPHPGTDRQRASTLRGELGVIGGVRREAVAEHRAEADALAALEAEVADVAEATTALREWSRSLEGVLEERYHQTLAAVRRHFDATYARLCGGGSADLIPVPLPGQDTPARQPPDTTGAGLDIVARPPGKRTAHLALLSGGERTLVAIALLFALLQVRPTAFCLLDEIEAALDESNVLRYATYLRELAAGTQFIVITHQKPSMEAADRLIGVTMRQGVSALVSVRLAG